MKNSDKQPIAVTIDCDGRSIGFVNEEGQFVKVRFNSHNPQYVDPFYVCLAIGLAQQTKGDGRRPTDWKGATDAFVEAIIHHQSPEFGAGHWRTYWSAFRHGRDPKKGRRAAISLDGKGLKDEEQQDLATNLFVNEENAFLLGPRSKSRGEFRYSSIAITPPTKTQAKEYYEKLVSYVESLLKDPANDGAVGVRKFGFPINKKTLWAVSAVFVILLFMAAVGNWYLKRPQPTSQSQIRDVEKAKSVLSNPPDPKLLSKVDEVARILGDPEASEVEKKLACNSLVMCGEEIFPAITVFAATYLEIKFVNGYMLDYLSYVHKKIGNKTSVLNGLFDVARRVFASSTKVAIREYIKDLFSQYNSSLAKKQQALILGYYLWRFNDETLWSNVLEVLSEAKCSGWDPVKRILLRGYLARSEHTFVLEGNTGELEDPGNKDFLSYLIPLEIEELGYEQMSNAHILLSHIIGTFYKSVMQIEMSMGASKQAS